MKLAWGIGRREDFESKLTEKDRTPCKSQSEGSVGVGEEQGGSHGKASAFCRGKKGGSQHMTTPCKGRSSLSDHIGRGGRDHPFMTRRKGGSMKEIGLFYLKVFINDPTIGRLRKSLTEATGR